jgi:hypothetical protein
MKHRRIRLVPGIGLRSSSIFTRTPSCSTDALRGSRPVGDGGAEAGAPPRSRGEGGVDSGAGADGVSAGDDRATGDGATGAGNGDVGAGLQPSATSTNAISQVRVFIFDRDPRVQPLG